MMADVKSHRVNAVIVKDLSRFGRESIYVNYYTQVYFPENSIAFIIIAENKVVTSDSRYDIMLALKSTINEMYPAEVSEKVRQAFSAKSKNGEFLHPFIPYGYVKSTVDRNKLVVDEDTQSNGYEGTQAGDIHSSQSVQLEQVNYKHLAPQ